MKEFILGMHIGEVLVTSDTAPTSAGLSLLGCVGVA